MKISLRLLVILSITLIRVKYSRTMPQNNLKIDNTVDNAHINQFNSSSLRLINNIYSSLREDNDVTNVVPSTQNLTIDTVTRNPCLLVKVASYFDDKGIRMILSNKFINLNISLNKCDGIFGSPTQKSVFYIDGDENSFDNLQLNALSFFDRDIRCYMIICSQLCTNFILNIAEETGFGVGIYFWITVRSSVLRCEMRLPKNLLFIEFMNQTSDIKSVTGDTMADISMSPLEGFVKYACDEKTLSRKEKLLMELMIFKSTGTYSINYLESLYDTKPILDKKVVLRVAMVTSSATKSRPDLLDPLDMKCRGGIKCFIFKYQNGSYADERGLSCCLGIFMDILLELENDLNVQFYVYEVEDRLWGSEINGSWNGLIGEVASGKADIAADWLADTESRQSVVDFTEPCLVEDIVLATTVDISPLPYLNLEIFDTLPKHCWPLMLAITIATGGIIYLTERLTYFHPNLDIITYAIGLLFQRDLGGLLPKCLGGCFGNNDNDCRINVYSSVDISKYRA